MRIVDKQIASKGSRRVVIYAACAIGDIAHDQSLNARTESCQDIRYRGSKNEQPFWKLQCYLLCFSCTYAVDRFMKFEGIVGWQETYGCVDILIV
jgi:hypothetical protein